MGKFINLYESAIQRFTRGGLLVGDLVKFKSGIFSDDFFKDQSPNYAEKIKSFIDSGLNIRVSSIKPVRPSYQPGNIYNESSEFLVDIVLEKAPGLYYDFITVPMRVLEHVDTGVNLAPIPDALRYNDKSSTDVSEVGDAKRGSETLLDPYRQTRTSDLGDGKDSKSETELSNTNVKIPSSPSVDAKNPSIFSPQKDYTKNYLPKKGRG
jgi:hypothetical protein